MIPKPSRGLLDSTTRLPIMKGVSAVLWGLRTVLGEQWSCAVRPDVCGGPSPDVYTLAKGNVKLQYTGRSRCTATGAAVTVPVQKLYDTSRVARGLATRLAVRLL